MKKEARDREYAELERDTQARLSNEKGTGTTTGEKGQALVDVEGRRRRSVSEEIDGRRSEDGSGRVREMASKEK